VLTGAARSTVPRRPLDARRLGRRVAAGRAFADSKLHGARRRPYRALDLIALARTASRDEGFAAEDDAIADLVMGDELRAGLYAFDLVQRRAKRPAGVPGQGARPPGHQGRRGRRRPDGQPAGAAVRAAARGAGRADRPRPGPASTRAWPTSTARSTSCCQGPYQPRQGQPAQGAGHRLDVKEAFADADVVIEAVFEDLKVKQQVFAEVEAVVSPTCVLRPTPRRCRSRRWPRVSQHPERVVGFHFFNPVASCRCSRSPARAKTDDASLATAFAVGKRSRSRACWSRTPRRSS
jgi:hypothetical protein